MGSHENAVAAEQALVAAGAAISGALVVVVRPPEGHQLDADSARTIKVGDVCTVSSYHANSERAFMRFKIEREVTSALTSSAVDHRRVSIGRASVSPVGSELTRL